MPVMASFLDSPLLNSPLPLPTQNAIIDRYWGQSPSLNQNNDLRAYWNFYTKECANALHDGGRHTVVRTHRDILDIVKLLKDDTPHDEIRKSLRSKLSRIHQNEDELLGNSIGLAARLLSMIDFGNVQYGFSGRRQLHWDQGGLRDYLESYFCISPALGHERVKLERIFTAWNLSRIAGVEIVPTNNLVDHLRLTDDDTKVYIFNHASFLKMQNQSYVKPLHVSMLLGLIYAAPFCPTASQTRLFVQ